MNDFSLSSVFVKPSLFFPPRYYRPEDECDTVISLVVVLLSNFLFSDASSIILSV